MTAWLIANALPYLIGVMGLLVAYWRGHHNGEVKATRKVMDRYNQTVKAINNADLGIGDSDAERARRLRDFAEKS